jgi:signal transduction histidine kinase
MIVGLLTNAFVYVVHSIFPKDIELYPESLYLDQYVNSESGFYADVDSAKHTTLSYIRDMKLEETATVKSFASDKTPYLFYIYDGRSTYTNSPVANAFLMKKQNQIYFAYESGTWTSGKTVQASIWDSYVFRARESYNEFYGLTDQYNVVIAFPDAFLQEKQFEWAQSENILRYYGWRIAISVAASILLLVYLLMVTGRRADKPDVYLSRIDRVYSDVLFIMLFVLGISWFALVLDEILYGYRYNSSPLMIEQYYLLTIFGLVTAAWITLSGIILLAFVRKIKAGIFLRHSIMYKLGFIMFDGLKSVFDGRAFARYPLTQSLFYRQLLFISGSFALVFLTFLLLYLIPPLFIVPPLFEVVLITWYVQGNRKTYREINQGLSKSLDEQLRAERLKVDLVTNVSHDLKTPLTSIISYIDLLSREKLPEPSSDYVKIIADKANRLNQMVSDLFVLSKSTSGNIELDMEILDLKKLVLQTMGDMEDGIAKSQLQMRMNLPDKAVMIVSDGKKLYRVLQNLVDNALKYSLQGTRVYVELAEKDGYAIVSVKNTANYEMNVSSDHMIQRFNRGDESRTSEGSGLGLSIAESFTQVCGGTFKIEIDGDLFKAVMRFPLNI